MRVLTLAPVMGAMLVVSGCAAVGPDFKAPVIQLSPTFVDGGTSSGENIAETAWWQQYDDPLLIGYIEQGLARNLDLEAAKEAVRQAEAELRETGINEALDGDIDVSRLREGGSSLKADNVSEGSFGPALVIDLFGGIRRNREGAKANVAAAQADLQVIRLEWLASMIEAYANARYYQQAAGLTEASIKARRDTLAITQRQFNAGDATNYEVAEARALLRTAEADLPQYRALFRSNVFAIANLLNVPAEPILAQMEKPGRQLLTPPEDPVGIPADLLRNRPDIRYDEALLHAAVADIGVAEAAMLPSISLTGSITTSFWANSWSFGPELTLPVLSQGLLAAERDAKISEAKQAELTWRSAVVDAVKDVQVALSNLKEYRVRATSLNDAAAAYGTALRLERENFRNGAITLLDLIDVDLEATSSQISAASALNDAALEWATLQIAMGAGAAVLGNTPIPDAKLTSASDSGVSRFFSCLWRECEGADADGQDVDVQDSGSQAPGSQVPDSQATGAQTTGQPE